MEEDATMVTGEGVMMARTSICHLLEEHWDRDVAISRVLMPRIHGIDHVASEI
jgi:hypothetical protein